MTTNAPNDILIRITRDPACSGKYIRDVLIAVNDETLIPELERTATFIAKCLNIFDKSDAEIEYLDAIQYAEGLAMIKEANKLPRLSDERMRAIFKEMWQRSKDVV